MKLTSKALPNSDAFKANVIAHLAAIEQSRKERHAYLAYHFDGNGADLAPRQKAR